jgi:acyl-homoserine-lactone acylase
MKARSFTGWVTHRGPIVRADGKRWVAAAMMNRPVEALQQSYLRTKAQDLDSFRKILAFKANSSNATIFADGKGEIAYLHPQFVPVRSNKVDYTALVDGSDPAADWGRIHDDRELPNVVNPASGFVFNSNNWPWTTAGVGTLRMEDWPRYMDSAGENPRGIHAIHLLTQPGRWDRDRLQSAAYDSAQPGFDRLIPILLGAYDGLPASDARKARLRGPIDALRGWDRHWAVDSVPQTIASVWATGLWDSVQLMEWNDELTVFERLERLPASQMIDILDRSVASLQKDFGRWQVPWGELNRVQRISSAITNHFSDSAPSTPVKFASARWGSLASIGSWPVDGSRRWYGQGGNSFVAVVEFSPRGVRARAVTAGGASGHENSPHFADQWTRFAKGDLRDVYFYPAQLQGHVERTYRPGE